MQNCSEDQIVNGLQIPVISGQEVPTYLGLSFHRSHCYYEIEKGVVQKTF